MRPVFLIDKVTAKPVKELEPGDVVIWNTGTEKRRKTVLRLFPTPKGHLYEVVLEDVETGKWMIERFGAERLFGIV